jgi:hypothetical protein
MIRKLNKSSALSNMVKNLKEDGVFIIEDYLEKSSLEGLVNETMEKIKNSGTEYNFGISYRGPHIKNFEKDSEIYKVFNSEWMKNLYSNFSNEKEINYGERVFSTYDYKKTNELANNGFLHFDRKSALKFFIYLSDINSENGAFYIAPKSNKYGKERRIKEWGSKKAHKLYDRNLIFKKLFFDKKFKSIDNRIQEDELKYKLIPVEAKAGSLIVFDSDTFHRGGIIKKDNLERLIIRLHCYKT